jgi:hypothetical protein
MGQYRTALAATESDTGTCSGSPGGIRVYAADRWEGGGPGACSPVVGSSQVH